MWKIPWLFLIWWWTGAIRAATVSSISRWTDHYLPSIWAFFPLHLLAWLHLVWLGTSVQCGRDLRFGDNGETSLKVCLWLTPGLRSDKRSGCRLNTPRPHKKATYEAPLIQQQTMHFLWIRHSKTRSLSYSKAFILKHQNQEMLGFHRQELNTAPEASESDETHSEQGEDLNWKCLSLRFPAQTWVSQGSFEGVVTVCSEAGWGGRTLEVPSWVYRSAFSLSFLMENEDSLGFWTAGWTGDAIGAFWITNEKCCKLQL